MLCMGQTKQVTDPKYSSDVNGPLTPATPHVMPHVRCISDSFGNISKFLGASDASSISYSSSSPYEGNPSSMVRGLLPACSSSALRSHLMKASDSGAVEIGWGASLELPPNLLLILRPAHKF